MGDALAATRGAGATSGRGETRLILRRVVAEVAVRVVRVGGMEDGVAAVALLGGGGDALLAASARRATTARGSRGKARLVLRGVVTKVAIRVVRVGLAEGRAVGNTRLLSDRAVASTSLLSGRSGTLAAVGRAAATTRDRRRNAGLVGRRVVARVAVRVVVVGVGATGAAALLGHALAAVRGTAASRSSGREARLIRRRVVAGTTVRVVRVGSVEASASALLGAGRGTLAAAKGTAASSSSRRRKARLILGRVVAQVAIRVVRVGGGRASGSTLLGVGRDALAAARVASARHGNGGRGGEARRHRGASGVVVVRETGVVASNVTGDTAVGGLGGNDSAAAVARATTIGNGARRGSRNGARTTNGVEELVLRVGPEVRVRVVAVKVATAVGAGLGRAAAERTRRNAVGDTSGRGTSVGRHGLSAVELVLSVGAPVGVVGGVAVVVRAAELGLALLNATGSGLGGSELVALEGLDRDSGDNALAVGPLGTSIGLARGVVANVGTKGRPVEVLKADIAASLVVASSVGLEVEVTLGRASKSSRRGLNGRADGGKREENREEDLELHGGSQVVLLGF